MVHYSVGGHYEPHVDYFGVAAASGGDRIATLLLYLSDDLLHGGATVFPFLSLGLKPRRGSALFWYNKKRNGDGDFLTMHAGCPVIKGTK